MSDAGSDDNPGVIMPPPVLHVSTLVIGIAIDFVDPLPIVGSGWQGLETGLGALLFLGGASLLAVCARSFRRACTNVPANRPAITLVTTGPHGLSRNPIYLGLLAIYLGAKFGEPCRDYRRRVRRWF